MNQQYQPIEPEPSWIERVLAALRTPSDEDSVAAWLKRLLVVCALAPITIVFIHRYLRGSWMGWREIGALVLAGLLSAIVDVGVMVVRRADGPRRVVDPTPRCPECGEAVPAHTRWCPSQSTWRWQKPL